MARPAPSFAALHLFIHMAASTQLVCYFTNRSQYRSGLGKFLPEDVDPFLCTHLVYAFATVSQANQLTESQWNPRSLYRSLTQLKRSNSDLKALLSVREQSAGAQFSSMASSRANRQTFIKSSIRFLRTRGFDGLDLDLQHLGANAAPRDRKSFALLCKELWEAFRAESAAEAGARLLLSAAADHDASGYHISKIAGYLDFINARTFDLDGRAGPTQSTLHHSALHSAATGPDIDGVVQSWLERGVPAERLMLGFPTHARAFTLSTSAAGLGARVRGPAPPGPYTQLIGRWSHYETCSFLNGASVQWSQGQSVPYAVKGNHWVGFDNHRSYNAKVDYLRRRRLGGAAVWTLDMDDFSGHFCERGKYPLVSHLKQRLSEVWTPEESSVPAPTATTSLSTAHITQGSLPTVSPDSGCSQNITLVFPSASFCSNREDGVYAGSPTPNTFYRCVQRRMEVTRCHAAPTPHSGCAHTARLGTLSLLSAGAAAAATFFS